MHKLRSRACGYGPKGGVKMPVAGDTGSSVTLILYSIDKDWWKGTEPFLNLLAAAAQLSSFTHVELAIGEGSGSQGEIVNVLRIFNDSTGAELTQRTGKNPNYQYVQIGCSQRAVGAMLHWARQQVGKPFSSTGMARSVLWPRVSDEKSWYCAELVAACLKTGGLMSSDSLPGAATPHSLYKMYKSQGAVMANPCVLRQQFGMAHATPFTRSDGSSIADQARQKAARTMQIGLQSLGRSATQSGDGGGGGSRHRSDSPPRMAFKVLTPRGVDPTGSTSLNHVTLSLASLNMNRTQ